MVKRNTALWIRRTHRYLGIFLGLQFLMWTISGLYFSWTNIDEIHGDQFKKDEKEVAYDSLPGLGKVSARFKITSLELKTITGKPFYWVNDSVLIDAKSGVVKSKVSKQEALAIASEFMLDTLEVKSIELLTETNKHHEYRERTLPAYVITYNHPENVKAYVSVNDGKFQRVRHRSWRWFDFLWMTHTMDYEGRDDFNTTVLRVFSLLGLITVLSGFILWFISSPTIRKILKK
ncbi:PepSY domain-containing protein [Aquimarina sp. 2201CG5-10]|uniref:PepSY domain-containing protein n=1 Tax=Aquimarina callyspongiae TaxID=3098150 RepID=UPI002AB3E8ED|nr:PepSY domain-containing protein [Aquimarina sp. 2201CG5-10]MDY8134719.1 PepSY domain-containing protein [Aquimarina sp. 2201CG5-10]